MIFFPGTEIPVFEIPEMIMPIGFFMRHESEEKPVKKVFINIPAVTAPVAKGIKGIGNAKGFIGNVLGEQVGKRNAATAIPPDIDDQVVNVLFIDGAE